jgi:magnesium-transporting ATPase (P-type)
LSHNRNQDHLKAALATCHTLARIDGKLLGDPLEETLFAETCAHIDPNDPMIVRLTVTPVDDVMDLTDREVGTTISSVYMSTPQITLHILQQYPFTSALQRMTVIVDRFDSDETTNNQKQSYVYVKGSRALVLFADQLINYRQYRRSRTSVRHAGRR